MKTVRNTCRTELHAFERELCVPMEDWETDLVAFGDCPWSSFVLNPRRLRGSDFLMRWQQGVWSEHRLKEAVNSTEEFYCISYGPSGVAPHGVRDYELYFEALEAAGLGKEKRPDLLVFRKKDEARVQQLLTDVVDAIDVQIPRDSPEAKLPFIPETDNVVRELLSLALCAVECENSLWVARSMPCYGAPLKPMRRLEGGLGLASGSVAPTIIVKQEDIGRLEQWQTTNVVPIHVWHAFFDVAYGISLDNGLALIRDGVVKLESQTYQAPGGQTSKKMIYKFNYQLGYIIGEMDPDKPPTLVADRIQDKNGHILPFVRFDGGSLLLSPVFMDVLTQLAGQ